MKNVIVLTSTYLPNPGANGLITHSLVKELLKKGLKITVVSVKSDPSENMCDNIDGVDIRRIPKSNYFSQLESLKSKTGTTNKLKLKLLIMQRRIKNILKIKKFPNFDDDQVEQTYKIVEDIIEERRIDTIIAINKPYSNIASVLILKEKYKNISFLGIFLDSIESIIKPKWLPKGIYSRLIEKNYKDLINSKITLFLPINMKNKLESKKIENKFIFFEFPTIKLENHNDYFKSENNLGSEISFMYAGSLDKEIRNPDLFLKTLRSLSNQEMKVHANIYGMLDQYSFGKINENEYMTYHGIKNHKEILKDYSDSDFLINISNVYTEFVPSKIFELFSTGKPIINFIQNDEDFSITYFERYPLHFNFYLNKPYKKQLEELILFIKFNKNKIVDKDEIINLYYSHTPEYFANMIMNFI